MHLAGVHGEDITEAQRDNKKYMNMERLEGAADDSSIAGWLYSCQGLQTKMRKILDTTPKWLRCSIISARSTHKNTISSFHFPHNGRGPQVIVVCGLLSV